METKDNKPKELVLSVINVKEAPEPDDAREPEPSVAKEAKSTPIISQEPTTILGKPAMHGETLVNYGYRGYGYGRPSYGYTTQPFNYHNQHAYSTTYYSTEECYDCCG